jgi:prevent-host-death family protein
MERIGVRELRQNASKYLRRVQAGETIEVADRGRPIARISPIAVAGWDGLVAEGRLRPGLGHLRDLGEPLPLPSGAELPSHVVERMRDE